MLWETTDATGTNIDSDHDFAVNNWGDYKLLMLILGSGSNHRTTIMVEVDSIPDRPLTVDFNVYSDSYSVNGARNLTFRGLSSGNNRTTSTQIRLRANSLTNRTKIYAIYGWKY